MEYGGCLYFELLNHKNGDEYYHKYTKNKVDVDSGRSALQFVLERFKFKRIWLPVYNCPLVGKRVSEVSNIQIVWYNLNEDFTPSVDGANFVDGDALLWVNYCGVMFQETINLVVNLQKRYPVKIIIDNIPAYFSEPRMEAINIYSCRKFVGVPEGGHVIGNAVGMVSLPTYYTAENYYYLLKAMESGSNSAYEDYQASEKRFSEANVAYGMPIITKKILQNINYEDLKARRLQNFRILHTILGKDNRLKFDDNTITPSIYPYLTRNTELRNALLENKIYISRFWKHVLTNELANNFEKDLAEYLIPLPVDQRYSEEDMKYIGNKVLELKGRTK